LICGFKVKNNEADVTLSLAGFVCGGPGNGIFKVFMVPTDGVVPA